MPATFPEDWITRLPHVEFAPAARRELSVFGAPVELVWLPHRKTRPGVPTGARPPFRSNHVERILAEEAVWREHGLALTGNKFPFAARQAVLWAQAPVREATLPMLEVALQLEAACAGTALLNTTGAAASIPRAHVHVVTDRLPFLDRLPRETFRAEYLDGVEALRLVAPFPCVAVGVRGTPAERARLAHRLLEVRTTAAVNLISSGGITWVLPHGEVEIPVPHFPHALGAAELWGRWCYADEAPFRAATGADLEQAILRAGFRT